MWRNCNIYTCVRRRRERWRCVLDTAARNTPDSRSADTLTSQGHSPMSSDLATGTGVIGYEHITWEWGREGEGAAMTHLLNVSKGWTSKAYNGYG